MRASLIDEMGADYLRTARAKGLREADVRRRHAVPNALLPTTTLIFLNLGFVVGGENDITTHGTGRYGEGLAEKAHFVLRPGRPPDPLRRGLGMDERDPERHQK